ncbi:MAG: aminodeoxychorismate/anthranilate synthase component II [Hyphomicrobiaceae bacterium]|nr:aminodeoxychorismate/anthranilate synthase component II [Hyphomicrobiaceae bacterium]MCC0023466.1 aminodeoxychorismate/anthranilate synthase component II [Hyphomicrobiaceae bacterium]
MRTLVIDNYDSFTYNLVHFLGELGATLDVVRNDKIDLEQIAAQRPEAIVLSPGPCTPTEAGICVPLIQHFHAEIPIFGVCLGMQSIAQALGGKVVHAPRLMHGKTSLIKHDGKGIFRGINDSFTATRYHSLAVEEDSLPNELRVTARATDDNVAMALAHATSPTYGVQFHPESIASEAGHTILKNFLDLARDFNLGHAA